jgi:hypothetical protein
MKDNTKSSSPRLSQEDLFPPEAAELLKDIGTSQDDVGVLLRCHLLAESILGKFLSTYRIGALKTLIPEPQQFGQKLALSSAFGLPVELGLAMHQLNLMRNKLAHGRGARVLPSDVQEFGRKVSVAQKSIPGLRTMEDFNMYLESSKHAGPQPYDGRGTRFDLIFAFAMLYTTLATWIVISAEDNAGSQHQ